jgi:hypothetical protein
MGLCVLSISGERGNNNSNMRETNLVLEVSMADLAILAGQARRSVQTTSP